MREEKSKGGKHAKRGASRLKSLNEAQMCMCACVSDCVPQKPLLLTERETKKARRKKERKRVYHFTRKVFGAFMGSAMMLVTNAK